VAKTLVKIDQNIFDAIWKEAKKRQPSTQKRTIYNRIQSVRKANGNTISPRLAAYLLASNMSIDIYKFVTDPSELSILRELRSRNLFRSELKETIPRVTKKTEISRKKNNKVFIVHGRDTKPANDLKQMLISFGLKPIILHEQASGSRTVIEKLEKYANVGYAFIILTPDDVGYFQKDAEHLFVTKNKKHPVLSDIPDFVNNTFYGFAFDNLTELLNLMKERARQNVILELGYFMALLKRQNVCCLYKGELDYPSDIRGIVYVPFKKSIKEVKSTIITELEGAKFQLKKTKKQEKPKENKKP
jgi:predicted nucleotide-binding protein